MGGWSTRSPWGMRSTPEPPRVRAMRLRVLGSSGTYPSAGVPASGFLLEHGETSIIMDLGPGAFTSFTGIGTIEEIDALMISHGHLDHCADLLAWYHAGRYGVVRRPAITSYAPDGVFDRVQDFVRHDDDEMAMVFDHHLVGHGDASGVKEVSLNFCDATHPVPTVATKASAGGSAIVYTGDTGWSDDVVELAKGVDALLCDATTLEDFMPDVHCTPRVAGRMAAKAGVERLLLTHLREDVETDRAIDQASTEYPGPIDVVRAGDLIEI